MNTLMSVLLVAAQLVWIGKFRELGEETFLLDYATGRFVKATAEELREAKAIDMRSETVSFRNGDVKLAGKVTLPAGKGPHPAVVLIHGSNDQDRDALDPWVGFFVSRGLAVLSYDKRGVRESGGDWKSAHFDDLAGDAAAGVKLLRARKDVDAKRIGLFGISQGGWIAPVVASRDRGIAFVILHAGSGLPVGENGLLYIDSLLRAYGFPDEEIAQAMAYYELNDEVTRDPSRFGELQASYDQARARKVEWLLEEPQAGDFWFRRFYKGIIDFDPMPYWAKVHAPVLAFLGELDHNVPPAANKKALEAALTSNAKATIVVLPSANHLFLRAKTGLPDEYATLTQFAGGYFDLMASWLAQHSATKKP